MKLTFRPYFDEPVRWTVVEILEYTTHKHLGPMVWVHAADELGRVTIGTIRLLLTADRLTVEAAS